MLEQLRAAGYRVFHDVKGGENFNIDHVLVGPGGVFAVETKTRSKPEGRDAKVVYDGECVRVDGMEPDRDPVEQARANADRVRDLLREMTGNWIRVRPVVVYPGWWVNQMPKG